MKRILLVAVLLGSANPVSAQESNDNEIEFIQKLRAKGWNDLARARIELLLKTGDADLKAVLPYELARVNLADARKKDPEQRAALFTAARGQLQDFIAKNKGNPQAAIARVELARVTSYSAEAILAKALREETDAERHKAARPAETMFVHAGAELEAALKSLDEAIKTAAKPELKARLKKEYNQARFDIAISYYNQGRTVLDIEASKDLEKRVAAIVKAKVEFEKLRKDESSQVGWLANAWLMKCGLELDTPNDFKKYYKQIYDRRNDPAANPDIQPAVRLARYFALQDLALKRKETEAIGRNVLEVKFKTTQERLEKLRFDAEAWLKQFPNFHKTYEGEGVHFELANSYLDEAHIIEGDHISKLLARIDKDKVLKEKGAAVASALSVGDFAKARKAVDALDKDAANAKVVKVFKSMLDEEEIIKKLTATPYDKAAVAFDKLAGLDGDLAERARQSSMSIKFKRLDVKGDLRTFAEYMMKARIERNAVIATSTKLAEHADKVEKAKGDSDKLDALKVEKKKIDDERKKALKDIIKSLHKAIALATPKTTLKDIDDARYFLSGAYLANGDAQRAAIVAEAIARGRASRRAPESAGTAIATYSAILAREPNNTIVRQRLLDMVDFVLTEPNWKTDAVTSTAHYHVGMLQRDANPKKALAHLEQIAPDFPDYIYVQGQIVFISEAAREKADDKKEEKVFLDIARKAIARMPKFNAKTDSGTVITMYFYAKLEEPKYMYSDAIEQLNAKAEFKAVNKCNEMKKYVVALRGEFDKLPGGTISDAHRERIDFQMSIMMKYADLGIAETKFRSDRPGRYEEVIDATKTVVEAALKLPKEGAIKLKDYRVTGDILGLALRAHVQKGDVDKGRAILDVLKRMTDPDGKQANVVGALLNDIAGQIQRTKKDDPKALEATKKNYMAFLDEIAKEFEKKGYDTNSTLMMAQAYKSLEIHAKAAALYKNFKPPVNFDKEVKKEKNETDEQVKTRQAWEEEVARYCGIQIEYIRTLRQANDKDSLEAGEKAAKALIDNKNAKYTIQARMERNLILEDQKRFREAFIEWGGFLKIPALDGKNRNDPNVQKIYYPAYFYYTRTCYRMAIHDPKLVNRQKFIDSAATLIVNLESSKAKVGWEIAGPMYKQLLEEKESDQLRKAYDALKGKTSMNGQNRDALAWSSRVSCEAFVSAGRISASHFFAFVREAWPITRARAET